MGLFGGRSKCGCGQVVEMLPLPNPDSSKFTVTAVEQFGSCCVVEVVYAGCTNYEGKKLMIYRASSDEIMGAKRLDPHFCEMGHLSPVARFEPTARGWYLAKCVAVILGGLKVER